MTNLTVKNIPPLVYARLKQQAENNRRSINSEIITILERALSIQPIDELETAYYFRFSAVDKPGVLSKISGILGEHDISIISVIQKGRKIDGSVPVVMMTHEARESNVRKALSLIDKLDVVIDKTIMIRVEEGK